MNANEIVISTILSIIILAAIYIVLYNIGRVIKYIVDDNFHIKLYMKKDKKFECKVDPIYNLDSMGYDSYHYEIIKWELGWKKIKDLDYILNIFIYPITVYKWGYAKVGSIVVGNDDCVKALYNEMEADNISLKDKYEWVVNIRDGISKSVAKEKEEFKDRINKINREFEENFIK